MDYVEFVDFVFLSQLLIQWWAYQSSNTRSVRVNLPSYIVLYPDHRREDPATQLILGVTIIITYKTFYNYNKMCLVSISPTLPLEHLGEWGGADRPVC